jgi:hypothetical protein
MGELDGVKGVWAYVEGGMGAVSESIASAARSLGAHIFTSKVGFMSPGVGDFKSFQNFRLMKGCYL